jgi:hypothetical protein
MLLVECKAFDITLSQQTILQVFTYNQVLQVPVLWISNGLRHMTFKMNAEQNFEFHSDDLIL